MPLYDAHKNFAFSSVTVPPSPALSGLALQVTAGDGALFPAVPFNAVVFPAAADPSSANAEIVRVTLIAVDTLTIVRAQEGSALRSIQVGDRIMNAITAKALTDIEAATNPGRAVLVFSGSITPNVNSGRWQTIPASGGGAFTVNAPTNPPDSSHTTELTIEVSNTSGGVLGVITWDPAFVLVAGAFTKPVNAKKRYIRFGWNGAAWIETSRASADY